MTTDVGTGCHGHGRAWQQFDEELTWILTTVPEPEGRPAARLTGLLGFLFATELHERGESSTFRLRTARH